MARTLSLLVLCLLTAPLLGGCIGLGGDGDATPNVTSTDLGPTSQAQEENASESVPLAFFPEPPAPTVLEESGSFTAANACYECIIGARVGVNGDQQAYDLTGQLPASTLVHLRMDLNYTAPSLIGDLDVYLYAPDAWVVQAESDGEAGHDWWDGTLVLPPQADARAVVFYNIPEAQPTVDYQLRIEITPVHRAVPAYVPVGFTSNAPGQTLEIDVAEGDQGEALIFGPDDELMGRSPLSAGTTELTRPENATNGEYVLFLTGLDQPARLSMAGTDAETSALRTLAVVREKGSAQSIAPHGETTWTLEAPRTPLQVGLWEDTRDSGCCESHLLTNVTIVSPDGTELVSFDQSCLICGGTWWFGSWLGDEALTPGTYELTWTTSATARATVGAYATYYQR